MQDTISVINQIGFPAAICLFVGYGLWKAAKWLGLECIKPIVVRHLMFIDSVDRNLTYQTRCLMKMSGEPPPEDLRPEDQRHAPTTQLRANDA